LNLPPCNLSIIIVNWNTRDLLAACLESVEGSKLNVAGSTFNLQPANLETLVVDNASSDGSASMVRERFPWVRLVENDENLGFARANNQGIELAQGRYVLLLNSDTVLRAGALAALVGFMDPHPAAGACGARLLNADGTLQPGAHPMLTPGRELWRLFFLERLHPRATYPMDRWDTVTPHRVEVIKGACLMLRRAALDQVGPLDDGYFMYTEEVDLCYRLAAAGWELWYVPAAEVVHFGGSSTSQAHEDMYVQLYRSKVQFYRKFGGEPRALRFKAALRLAYAPRWIAAAVAGRFSPSAARQARTFRRLLTDLPGM
jgi:N-acetylglucosaminyl-diphospho-decaprenol L-rhamnosyltransferase